ncbi:UDP-N-acetylmuramoyl-tripeptide--D-alanyl-D-alanine ligase [Paenibacillus spongiae]|uniref:UDP-N-acetylmuramoyl-tripeptide--D-alanyl-D-alanine ligase n=1 Tax=Paenibacillus spongiae TaxID=2909671 RepID=A0ABY5SJI3_9BACL|nr:UDP-N-acetylmuramoyl-tripeptide--D-alanyl-D-alanine ligase [Paenibacillus spongiae]UVI32862.1 UDP-N-acetylmuramoyl-tripeptide--D-alanyl-D-alanine ligase [Paenibacillus spongiae]
MITRTLKEIERMTGGGGLQSKWDGIEIRGVSIDSKSVEPGNLFIPIVRVKDGHDYVPEAIASGAAAALWQTDHPNPPLHIPIIFVDSGMEALQLLAGAYRAQQPVKVIGITGSNGKTTTKDMIDSILGTTYKVHKTKGNLNSQVGVPLTLLRIAPDTEIAVIEMGMSERGQIERLSRIAKPDLAVITMIGVSHLATLGSREEIAAAKLEIAVGMPPEGVLLLNGDEPLLLNGIKALPQPLQCLCFGEQESNAYRADAITTGAAGTRFSHGAASYQIPLPGKHNALNAIAAIAVAELLSVGESDIRRGLQQLSVSGMRMEVIRTAAGFTIINDAWNASPVSVKAAIETFEVLTEYPCKIIVLGDMLELGVNERIFHREIGRIVNPGRIDYLFTLGVLAREIAEEAASSFPKGRVRAFTDMQELIQEIRNTIQPTPTGAILIKGSRGMALENIVTALA